MNIVGYQFRKVTGTSFYNGPGIFIYIHQASGKYFVRAMRNSRAQRGKNNYPNYLKELLKIHSCEVLLYFTELPSDTKEALYTASQAIVSGLSEMGKLYKRPKPNRRGIQKQSNGEPLRFTIWSMTHKDTGAVFYFEEVKGVEVVEKVVQRLRTFNNYVAKNIANANRVMYFFAKAHLPLQPEDWVVRDLELSLETEQKALLHTTRLSKQHLDNNEVVLNRVSNIDALYYRNTMLKLPHLSVEEYLKKPTA